MLNDCEKPVLGPLGSVVGHCDRRCDHEGFCAVNGVTEQEMVARLHDAHMRDAAGGEE